VGASEAPSQGSSPIMGATFSPVRHGLFLPPFDALADPALLARLAAEAEEAGWDGVFLWDHLLYSEPVRRILDPWICLAAMATATERIALGPMVTPLARRRPAVVARQAVTLDHLSRGRLVLGFGLGDDGRVGELSRFGEETDPPARAALLEEGLDILTGLLSGAVVRHDGPGLVANDVAFEPLPFRSGGIPIWIGARWPNRRPIRRSARYDGVFAIRLQEPADVTELRRLAAADGADLGRFDVVVQGAPDDDPAPWADAGVTWWLTQLGPYRIGLTEVRRVVSAGPRRTAAG
jgi:alkanesulfonate monooxygenase SsuD/methylene tetrahydromethanopterin reductase-like flavin-dependent oxidoreductase (luciferase family)